MPSKKITHIFRSIIAGKEYNHLNMKHRAHYNISYQNYLFQIYLNYHTHRCLQNLQTGNCDDFEMFKIFFTAGTREIPVILQIKFFSDINTSLKRELNPQNICRISNEMILPNIV